MVGHSEHPRIKTEHDLRKAIPDAVSPERRSHIHKAAAHLGLTHLLPKAWRPDGSLKDPAPDKQAPTAH